MKDKYILFFDTETTGLPTSNGKTVEEDLYSWPRMVQLSWIVADSNGNIISEHNKYITPEDFVIPNDAVRIHGITTQFAMEHGENLSEVLHLFEHDLLQAEMIVCHNVTFDKNVILGEFLRKGMSTTISTKKSYCTMLEGTDICAIPQGDGYKWPKLIELYRFLFNEGFGGAHDAIRDVRAVVRCFFEMRKGAKIITG